MKIAAGSSLECNVYIICTFPEKQATLTRLSKVHALYKTSLELRRNDLLKSCCEKNECNHVRETTYFDLFLARDKQKNWSHLSLNQISKEE